MQAEDTSGLMAEQRVLREQADALASRLDDSGWTVTATPADATRSFLGRLIGGAQTVQSDVPDDRVAVYLANASLEGLQADLTGLIDQTRALSDQTLLVASSDGLIDAATLERDLAAVERALGAVRRAQGFFGVIGTSEAWGEDDRASIDPRLDDMANEKRRLETAADALAERRWASRAGLFG